MTAVIADGYYRIVSALYSSLDVGGIYMNYNANDPAFPAGTHGKLPFLDLYLSNLKFC